MDNQVCPICNNASPFRLKKTNTNYFQCHNCKTLFSAPLDNDNMVGGGNEVQRNQVQNQERIERINSLLGGIKEPKILDFGCGHGMLVNDLKQAGYDAYGFDLYNPEYSTIPKKETYHLITAIEVVEHLSKPFIEIEVMFRSLVKRGLLMVETSFVDIAAQEGIELEDFFYIEPSVGHSTIFSHHGLDLLMATKGLPPLQHFNRNVRLFYKK